MDKKLEMFYMSILEKSSVTDNGSIVEIFADLGGVVGESGKHQQNQCECSGSI